MTEIEMTSLLLQLADLGVTGIKIHYDGSGDSGSVVCIAYTKEKCETPSDMNYIVDVWDGDQSLAQLDQNLYKEFENYAYKLLEGVEDWYNNEGGFGDICIMIPSGKYEIHNNVRIIDTEFYLHEGELLDKTNNN